MTCLSSFGRPIWGSSCWLWRKRGQNSPAQLHPRSNIFSSSNCCPCTKERVAISNSWLPSVPNWDRGRPTALAVTVISTLQQFTVQGAAITPGHALAVGENKKMSMHASQCQAVGVSFVPLVIESLGGWSDLAVKTLSSIGHLLGQRLGILPSDSVRHLFQQCAISLWKGNASLWLH